MKERKKNLIMEEVDDKRWLVVEVSLAFGKCPLIWPIFNKPLISNGESVTKK